jgi:hypothetical protein
MATEHRFPARAPASVPRDDVVRYLQELQAQGWVVFLEADGFSIQSTETDLLHLTFNDSNGTCTFRGSSSAHGLTFPGPTVRNMDEFVAAMARAGIGGPTPARSVRTRRGEPAHNMIRVADLIRKAQAKVEAVYDGYLDDVGLRTFSTLVRLSRAASPRVRLLTSRHHGANALNPQWAAQLLHELGCPQAEIRQMSNKKGHEGRFLLLSGGRTLRLGMSLNGFDTNDAGHVDVEGDREDRELFEREWADAKPI